MNPSMIQERKKNSSFFVSFPMCSTWPILFRNEILRHCYSYALANNRRRRNLDNEGVSWPRDTLIMYLCSHSFTIHNSTFIKPPSFRAFIIQRCIIRMIMSCDFKTRIGHEVIFALNCYSNYYNSSSSEKCRNSSKKKKIWIRDCSKNLISNNNANSSKIFSIRIFQLELQ